MRKFLRILAILLLFGGLNAAAPRAARAAAPIHATLQYQGFDRTYHLFTPDNPLPQRPLVFCLHGYGGKADGYKQKFVDQALAAGYAVCLPQGEKDPNGSTGWNVKYPKQEGMTTDDIAFIIHLSEVLIDKYGFSPANLFFCGMSNGGEMCYLMAYTHPEHFNAIASVAGLQMDWIIRELEPRGPVPFMEIHGTADKTSRWEGDPTNQYGWGKYLAVPAAVSNMVAIDKCTVYSKKEASSTVILHHYTGGLNNSEVLFYEVTDGTHSWAEKDFDVYTAILNFFSAHLN